MKLELIFSPAAAAVLEEAQHNGRFRRLEDFFVSAAWNQAVHLDVDVPRGVLELPYDHGGQWAVPSVPDPECSVDQPDLFSSEEPSA
jgi:hypothetical protein